MSPKRRSLPPDAEGWQRVATRSQNKNICPGIRAGVAPKPRAPKGTGQTKKALKQAAKDEAHAIKERKVVEAARELACIEREGTVQYATNDTPRPRPTQSKATTSAVTEPLAHTDTSVSSSESSSMLEESEFELTSAKSKPEEDDLTDTTESKMEDNLSDTANSNLSDIQATPKKKRAMKKRSQVQDAVSHFNHVSPISQTS